MIRKNRFITISNIIGYYGEDGFYKGWDAEISITAHGKVEARCGCVSGAADELKRQLARRCGPEEKPYAEGMAFIALVRTLEKIYGRAKRNPAKIKAKAKKKR